MNEIDIHALNLNLLPALSALLSEGNVSAAARRAGVSQSAMSHTLARLREALGDPLLVPSGRSLVLTPRARALAARLPPVLEQLQRVLAEPEVFEPATARRTFRVATLDYFEFTMLPDVLAHLRAYAPGIDVEVLRYSASTLGALAAGEIDLALIGGTPGPLPSGLSRRALLRDPFAVLLRPDHPRVGRHLDLDTYVALEHALISVEGRREGVVDRALARLGRGRRVALRVPHFIGACLAVLRSDLVCTAARTVALKAKELFGLRMLAPPLELPEVSVHALWPSALDLDPANRWLRRLVRRPLTRCK